MQLAIIILIGIALIAVSDAISTRRLRKRDQRIALDKRLHQGHG